MKRILLILAFGLILAAEGTAAVSDYTFSCWQDGWRKNDNDQSADLFGIETSRYGFVLDMDDFSHAQFGRLSNPAGYEQALEHKAEKLKGLAPARFLIELETEGVKYRAETCKAGLDRGVKHLSSARMWESGRFVQHFDFLGLDFRNASGERLACDATLDLVAWPDALTFNLRVTPAFDMKNTSMRISLTSNAGDYGRDEIIEGPWKKDDTRSVTLTCSMPTVSSNTSAQIMVSANDGRQVPVAFDESKNCHVAYVANLKRKWETGYTDIRDYDDFKITVHNSDRKEPIPFLLDMRSPANITGV